MGTLSSHLKMAGPALVAIFWFAALFSPALSVPYHDPLERCFDGKMLPVHMGKNWTGVDCYDNEGNKYQEKATLISCCGCLKLTCENHKHPEGTYPSMTSNWNMTQSDSCCKDCNGTVYPAGAVMSTEKIDDHCQTTITTKCVYVDVDGDKGEAVTEVSYGFKNCCIDDKKLKDIDAFEWEPKTCSKRVCELPEGNKFASWISTIEKHGCDCCLVGNKLIEDGKNCTIPDQPNAVCCEGQCRVPVN